MLNAISAISCEMMMRSTFYYVNRLSWIFNPLKQQSVDRHVTPLGNIMLIPTQPVFALSPECCVLSGEATNTNFIVFGLTQSGLEPMIYRTRGEHTNHYNTDAVFHCLIFLYNTLCTRLFHKTYMAPRNCKLISLPTLGV